MTKPVLSPAARVALLAELARALDVSPGAFFSGSAEGEHPPTVALMTLWSAITDGPGRNRVLSLARLEAARCGYVEPQ